MRSDEGETVTERRQLIRRARAEGVGEFMGGVAVLDGSGRVLTVRRRPEDTYGGQWELPGGSLDPGEDPERGAARELAEETGLTGLALAYLHAVDFTGLGGVRARQFVFTAAVPDGTPVTLSEHDAHRWSPLDDLPAVSAHHLVALALLRDR
ncbi:MULTISPECIES: NUDIX hydrolase [Kitasatospora]|uniref:Putative hydrolase n=1 Tax=Kitasatospora setae (strain ATCC 33774 / DSM 43861 / JCM 3304 / KCC A-0304 / NBRC 14216 / KM-6054) TaxID=452652 RepID=E4N467_KITSK|nr:MULTISPECIES: NUDIX hydrolase [Kitasatospora]BAJ25998.1 putative hydrolase [Kitasatospora setae KM-6054]